MSRRSDSVAAVMAPDVGRQNSQVCLPMQCLSLFFLSVYLSVYLSIYLQVQSSYNNPVFNADFREHLERRDSVVEVGAVDTQWTFHTDVY